MRGAVVAADGTIRTPEKKEREVRTRGKWPDPPGPTCQSRVA
jgi:hypothetical protein